jgi:hypothetical protein
MPPKRKMVPKSQVNATVLNLNDKVKFFRFDERKVASLQWKLGSVTGRMNQASIVFEIKSMR